MDALMNGTLTVNKNNPCELYDIVVSYRGKKRKQDLHGVQIKFIKELDCWKIENPNGEYSKIIPQNAIKCLDVFNHDEKQATYKDCAMFR